MDGRDRMTGLDSKVKITHNDGDGWKLDSNNLLMMKHDIS